MNLEREILMRLLMIGLVLILIVGCSAPAELKSTPTTPPKTGSSGQSHPEKMLIPHSAVTGKVLDSSHKPVPEAVIRQQATTNHTLTDENGGFRLENVPLDKPASITAWAEGFFINNALATAEEPLITIKIHRIPLGDNPNYEWLTSGIKTGDGENQGCAECHAARDSKPPFPLTVDEWLLDAHSQSALNPRFVSTYNGSDVFGNQGPLTTFIPTNPSRHNAADYKYIALAPNPEKPYFGPGYKLDFPESDGNCGNCHVPGAAAKPNKNYAVNVNLVEGVQKEGIFCDFCHKISDVQVDPQTNLPASDSPGVMSYLFQRPAEGHQFFAGPYDDVAPGEDTYSAIQNESIYCAPCHFGVFWDNEVYNSFGEWLQSPYSDPHKGQTCQDCHMPHTGATLFAREDMGGIHRDPDTIFSHNMTGAMNEDLLLNAVSLNVDANLKDDKLYVAVQIVNDKTGHHVPTDYPGRHLILHVGAIDENGDLLQQEAGPVLPEWTGTGEPADGYYAGHAGEAYAKVLQEDWTGYYPTVAYWNPHTVISDNRIGAFETASSKYIFTNPSSSRVRLEVRLFLRRSFIELMDWKEWDIPDILMEEEIIELE